MMKDGAYPSHKPEIHAHNTQDEAMYHDVQGQYYIHPSGFMTVRQTEGCTNAVHSDQIHMTQDASYLNCYYNEHAFVPSPDVFLHTQGSTYMGYPAPMMNFHGHIPYDTEGVYYQCMNFDSNVVDIQPYDAYIPAVLHCGNVDTNVVDMQPYYGPPSAGHRQFVTGISNEYVHNNNGCIPISQYPPSSISQYGATSPPLPEGVLIVQENSGGLEHISNGYSYYPHAGTLMPVYMASPMVDGPPSLSCDPFPYAHPLLVPSSTPSMLRASAPDWIQQPSKPKGSQKADIVGVELSNNPGHGDHHNPPKIKSILKTSSLVAAKKMDQEDETKTSITPVNQMFVPNKSLNASHLGSYHQNGTLTHPVKNVNGNALTGLKICLQPSQLDDAKYFIIKSFNEPNVYRSIQHGVWSSTLNGNRKLDEAFKDAQYRAKAKGSRCPIFLFFSVNGSGRFCGVAEMLGCLDYNKTMEFWEQNKWSGSFQVKWHIIKDVPNSQFRKIILPNNENKSVTSSRDTQEVNFQQGYEMLEIFRSYPTKSSILESFKDTKEVVVQECKQTQSSSSQVCSETEPTQEPGVKSMESKSNTLRTCNNAEIKPRGTCQPKSILVRMDSACNSHGGRKTDKENMMIGSLQPMA